MENLSVSEYGSFIRNTNSEWRYLNDKEINLIDVEDIKKGMASDRIEKSLKTNGFITLKCPDEIYTVHRKVLDKAANFFAMLEHDKKHFSFNSIEQQKYGNVGYYPFFTEKAVSHNAPDIKEFIHFGQRSFNGGELAGSYPGNDWLNSHFSLKEALEDEYLALQDIGELLFPQVGDIYGLDKGYLRDLVKDGNSILRVIHYPATESKNHDAMRAAPHHGMNLMGLQPPSNHHGLQFCTIDNDEWVALPPSLGASVISVNLGRMFSYITNGKAIPTLHRVVNNQDGSERVSRYTGVHFFHANPNKYLKPVRGKDKLDDVLVGDWLLNRLKKIKIRGQ